MPAVNTIALATNVSFRHLLFPSIWSLRLLLLYGFSSGLDNLLMLFLYCYRLVR